MPSKPTDKEITKAILDAVKDINLEHAIKGAPVYSLTEMLSGKNITSLRKLGKLHMVKCYSKLGKQELMLAICDKLLNADMLMEVFYILYKDEWEFFKKVATKKHLQENKVYVDSYQVLYTFGIIELYYNENKLYFVVPDEIKKVYKNIESTDFLDKKTYYDLLNNYAKAATHLYGVIKQDDFVELFNRQNERKTNIDEMFPILIKHVAVDAGYCFWDDYIVNDEFEPNDFKDVEYYAKVATSKLRYMPAKDEFLKYADYNYFKITPQIVALSAYINENLCNDTDETDEIVEEIHFLCTSEAKTQEYINVFHDHNITFEFEQLQELMTLIMDVHNNTRLWLNNGHTPMELAKKEKSFLKPFSAEPFKANKISRSQPCPCGSGKKYKRCCGKD